jgi:hypothetical protein
MIFFLNSEGLIVFVVVGRTERFMLATVAKLELLVFLNNFSRFCYFFPVQSVKVFGERHWVVLRTGLFSPEYYYIELKILGLSSEDPNGLTLCNLIYIFWEFESTWSKLWVGLILFAIPWRAIGFSFILGSLYSCPGIKP